ncbi:MAG: DUF3560 domain-containing protein [Clostridia bacterium]|nr:DUF3560 domain-containing protein [Clostridia bacterium]
MGGRSDYYERQESRKERLKILSEKANQRSHQYSNSNANRILELTPGQPIIIGHHSEKKHRRLIEKAHNDIRKSIEESDKSEYYKNKVRTIESNKVIYNDDPNAIQKLKDKLEYLEKNRELMKQGEHQGWELQNIGARIREIKRRISALEKQENIEFETKEFEGGKIVHNKEINRIQILFDSIPNEDIRKELKHRGFHWSRNEGAWQRQFNEQTIRATNIILKDTLNKEQEFEEESEFE